MQHRFTKRMAKRRFSDSQLTAMRYNMELEQRSKPRRAALALHEPLPVSQARSRTRTRTQPHAHAPALPPPPPPPPRARTPAPAPVPQHRTVISAPIWAAQIAYVSQYLGVDSVVQPHLMWVASAALCDMLAPALPAGWEKARLTMPALTTALLLTMAPPCIARGPRFAMTVLTVGGHALALAPSS